MRFKIFKILGLITICATAAFATYQNANAKNDALSQVKENNKYYHGQRDNNRKWNHVKPA